MPRIKYDSNRYINLRIGPESLTPKSIQYGDIQYSGGGRYHAVNRYAIDSFTLDVRFDEDTYRQLYSFWWHWARKRYIFSFSMDTTSEVDTTLDGSAAADQAVIPLTSTAGLAQGDTVLLKSATTLDRQVAEVLSVSAGVSITIDQDLLTAYASGDTLRHNSYLPYLICTDEDFEPLRVGQWYRHTFGLIEAYSDGYLDVDEGVLEL